MALGSVLKRRTGLVVVRVGPCAPSAVARNSVLKRRTGSERVARSQT